MSHRGDQEVTQLRIVILVVGLLLLFSMSPLTAPAPPNQPLVQYQPEPLTPDQAAFNKMMNQLIITGAAALFSAFLTFALSHVFVFTYVFDPNRALDRRLWLPALLMPLLLLAPPIAVWSRTTTPNTICFSVIWLTTGGALMVFGVPAEYKEYKRLRSEQAP